MRAHPYSFIPVTSCHTQPYQIFTCCRLPLRGGVPSDPPLGPALCSSLKRTLEEKVRSSVCQPVPIAQMVERPLREGEFVGSIPGRAIHIELGTNFPQSRPLVKDCQFGVSPVNYSDSDSDTKGVKNGTNSTLLGAQHYKASTGSSLTHS